MKNNKGISLIVLVITIIVMIILAGVVVITLNSSGIIDKAQQATNDTQKIVNDEQKWLDGAIQVDDVWYDSIDDYLAGFPSTGVKIGIRITGKDVTNVPIPTGFTYKEGAINTGYVIQDTDGNEFVWIPVKKEQKISLSVESKVDIDELTLYDPYGNAILTVKDSEIEKTYNNAEIIPNTNGMYMAVAKTEKGITQKTLIVKSLFARDTYNDLYTSDLFAELHGYDTIEEYFLAIKSMDNMQQVLDAYKAPTLEVAKSIHMQLKRTGVYQDTTTYNASVEKNGGFYIARYEAGAQVARKSKVEDAVESIIEKNGVPVSKSGYIPYNRITYTQSLGLAESMYESNDSFTSSLPTAGAWDRIVGWIYETKAKNERQIYFDSGVWGNYADATFNITNGKYSEDTGSTYITVSGTYTKPANKKILLTTGATARNSANNIFDLAGGVWENTLETFEKDGAVSYVARGGSYYNVFSDSDPVMERAIVEATNTNSACGFRVALYLQ